MYDVASTVFGNIFCNISHLITIVTLEDVITSDAVVMNRRILLGQLATIRSLMDKTNDADVDDVAKEGMPRNDIIKPQLAALLTDVLLMV